jgi:hypothetical protein
VPPRNTHNSLNTHLNQLLPTPPPQTTPTLPRNKAPALLPRAKITPKLSPGNGASTYPLKSQYYDVFTLPILSDNASYIYPSSLRTVSSAQTYTSSRQAGAISNRRLFITKGGGFGLCPKATQIGDAVVFLYGCRVPMILRRVRELGV